MESDEEAVIIHEAPPPIVDFKENKLNVVCQELFQNMASFLQGEIKSSSEEYNLLQKMNEEVLKKYKELEQTAKMVDTSMHSINYQYLQPYLQQIDNIEQGVIMLEKNAYKLDAYAKRLEEKFKKLEKK